jgi:hypothetical protein
MIIWWQVARPALLFLGCVVLGATAASTAGSLLAEHPRLAEVFMGGVAIISGLSGLWCFWLLAEGVDFARRGYRIRQLPPKEYWRWKPGPKACVYEEWTQEVGIRRLTFIREILADGYPAPSIIRIPGDNRWDAETPEWARRRRGEIIERIRECTGSNTQVAES